METRRGFIEILGKAVGGLLVSSMLPNIAEAKSRGTIYLPNLGEVGLHDLVLPDGHFTWSEVTKKGTRIPKTSENLIYTSKTNIVLPDEKENVENLLRVAHTMEEVRNYFGNRYITVISWYRDPVSNTEVNGKPNSRHMYGDAVDFKVEGMHPYDVHDKLNKFWGSRGGLGRYPDFTHLDIRGYKARWNGS